LAGRLLPSVVLATQGERKIGYAVIGLGLIADHFMRGVQSSPNSKITGLVSGHRDKAERIAAQYGVPKSSIYSYEDMDKFRDNKTIDAVYVALPNKHACGVYDPVGEGGQACVVREADVYDCERGRGDDLRVQSRKCELMIAYRLHYEPLNLKAVKLIRDGALGKVQTINGAFGFNANPTAWRLNKALAGVDRMFDVGIYVLNASRYLTGEEPVKFTAVTSTIDQDGRFKTMEENVSWTTKFPSGSSRRAAVRMGRRCRGTQGIWSKGWPGDEPAFNYDGLKLRASFSSGEKGSPNIEIDDANPERDPMHFYA